MGYTGGLFGVKRNLNLDMSGLDSERWGVPLESPAAGLPLLIGTVCLADMIEEDCNRRQGSVRAGMLCVSPDRNMTRVKSTCTEELDLGSA